MVNRSSLIRFIEAYGFFFPLSPLRESGSWFRGYRIRSRDRLEVKARGDKDLDIDWDWDLRIIFCKKVCCYICASYI